MAAPYVTSAEILAQVGNASPSAADTTWAGIVASAIEAAIAERLDGATASADMESELQRSALVDGCAAGPGVFDWLSSRKRKFPLGARLPLLPEGASRGVSGSTRVSVALS